MTEQDLELMHRYLDGVLTPGELEELEHLLRADAEARATLRSLATIDAKWQQLAAGDTLGEQDAVSVGVASQSRWLPAWVAAIAVAVALVVGGLGWLVGRRERGAEVDYGIARVIRIAGEGWVDGERPMADGADLFSGDMLVLSEGIVELAFRESGVHVVATAPLELRLDSDQRVLLRQGQVKLVVPPQGVGFVVDTAEREFVDLGTSFVVTASPAGSEVLVLDGQISVDHHDGTVEGLMYEGEFARFDQTGKIEKRRPGRLSRALPELNLPIAASRSASLTGVVLGYRQRVAKQRLSEDVIGGQLLPLIQSGFRDSTVLENWKSSEPIAFHGIAGAYHTFPKRAGLAPFYWDGGWMAWYQGQVLPPRSGRYRFWGYADNHLLVAVNGEPVFEGSRHDSSLRELGIPRTDHPALPCLIAQAGFACSDWIEMGDEPVRLDLLFGEVGGDMSSGLLLIEREGDHYEETFWGQPKWPLFLTESPEEETRAQLQLLLSHLEENTMGSFSIAEDAIWKVVE